MVDDWLATGLVRVWEGPVGTLRAGAGAFARLPPSPPRYVAVGGMRRLAEALGEQLEAGGGSSLVEFRRPCWVGKMQVGGWVPRSVVPRCLGPAVGCMGGGGRYKLLYSGAQGVVGASHPVPHMLPASPPGLSLPRTPALLQSHWRSLPPLTPYPYPRSHYSHPPPALLQAEEGRGWALSGEGRSQGVYDAVVVAHNGKCANRLVGPTGERGRDPGGRREECMMMQVAL